VDGSAGCQTATRLAHATARLDGRVLPPDCLGSVGTPTEPNFSDQARDPRSSLIRNNKSCGRGWFLLWCRPRPPV